MDSSAIIGFFIRTLQIELSIDVRSIAPKGAWWRSC
jgi:hypothetical protein